MSFLEDGARALEWAAGYREGVGDLPVLSRAQPGDVRALLPASAPEHGLPFESLLEDIDRVILPGVTHWQSPRFFAYFSTTGSAPGVLAELLTAALNNVGILWRASPALQELEETVLAWLAELIGLPPGWHGHLEEGASLSTLAALAAAREAKPGLAGRRLLGARALLRRQGLPRARARAPEGAGRRASSACARSCST